MIALNTIDKIMEREIFRINNLLKDFETLMSFDDSCIRYSTSSSYLYENDGEYVIEIDAPGFSKEDISVFVEDNILYVEAQSKKDESKHRRNRKLSKQYRLANYIDTSKISASYENGVIKISIPKPVKNVISISVN